MKNLRTENSGDPGMRARRPLDALNFFLADVRDGLGPYLAIYLLTEQKWDEASIGIVMSIATSAGILAQTPAGALVDVIRAKRGLMMAAALAHRGLFIAPVAFQLLVRGSLTRHGACSGCRIWSCHCGCDPWNCRSQGIQPPDWSQRIFQPCGQCLCRDGGRSDSLFVGANRRILFAGRDGFREPPQRARHSGKRH